VTRGPHRRIAYFVLAALLVTAAATGSGPAGAAPGRAEPPAGAPDARGDAHSPRDKDNRTGTLAPTAGQRARASRVDAPVQWNALGTPSAFGPAAEGLATGLAADPLSAARQYLMRERDLFGLDEAAVVALEPLLVHPVGAGSVVLLRQRFGDLPAGHDGLVAILVRDGKAVHVTSSLSRAAGAPPAPTLSTDEAYRVAVADAGLGLEQVAAHDTTLVAVPTPADGPRAAYAVTLSSADLDHPVAFTTYVDARSGAVLVREDLVDFDSDNPQWAVFESTPAAGPRVVWCLNPVPGCSRAVRDPVSGQAWDVDLATGAPTLTSRGNAANDVLNWGAGNPPVPATASPTRTYVYPLLDQWHAARCNPEVFASAQRNDADAAVTNLFAMHNRMHDWAYHLGFTEATWNLQAVNLGPAGLGGDAEQGRAQAGAVSGSRNNANQGTGRDGQPPSTNMFLWQPVAGSAYPPCVDGDFDMTVIGHEYTHAITNRMIAGPNSGIGSFQGGAMGESWSDMVAAEYLFEYGLRPPGETPFITGGYVTGNLHNGIRNYDMSRSPLNYSDVGYDRSGPGVHADGEIWSATNMRIRSAFVQRYGLGVPDVQARCADGQLPVTQCPGNRRWMQLMFDSFLLQAGSQFSMLDMRNNMLAADLVRFNGANQDILWNAFAESGMGRDAASGPSDLDPTPSFASPYADNASVRLRPVGESTGAVVQLYVGDHEARAVPVADTDPQTPLPDTFSVVPDRPLPFLAAGVGFGHHRLTASFAPGATEELKVNLPPNLAAGVSGAAASGDGVNLDKAIDETEETNWASLDGVAGRQVTVDLAGGVQLVQKVNVSAMLRPPLAGDADPDPQGSLTALRSFEIQACVAILADCTQDASYHTVYVSAPDAFPAGAFRAFVPDINLRSFPIPPTVATHLRLRVLASQCTGGPAYAGEQDDDPRSDTDCATASPTASQVRIAEFQVFRR
jgi:extracellular elastinolytic metalloproteinase